MKIKFGAQKQQVEPAAAPASEENSAAPAVPAQMSAADVADRMQGLTGLRDMGILTEEEFVVQRGKLLGLEV